jgi:iron complex transport system substrate-binding protein
MKNSYRILVGVLVAVSLILSTCSTQAEPGPTSEQVTEIDGLNRSVSFSIPVQRVVTLTPANAEILFAIGAGDKIVGRDAYADYPQEVMDIQSIGGPYSDINTEMILSLEPDLVLASELTPSEQVQAMEDLGLVVFVVPNPTSLDELYNNFRLIAQFTGNQEQTEAVIGDFITRFDEITKLMEGVDYTPLVYYELDGTDPNAPWVSGPGTFIDMLIGMAGGKNLGADYTDPWIQLSGEEIIAQNPDVIILGDSIFGVTADDVISRPGWDTIKAVNDGKVYPFDDDLVSRPGPRLVQGLEELARIIHPEVFGQ